MDNIQFVQSRNGNFILSENDFIISRQLINNKVWEPTLLDIIDSIDKPDSVMIDCGANIGSISVYMSKKCNTVYAFEASKKHFFHLCGNLWLNQSFNVIPINNVLSDNGGEKFNYQEIDYNQYGNYGDLRFHENVGNDVSISCCIDDFNIEREVSFIKVDCQGMDLIVLRGAIKTINKYKPVIVFEYEEPYSKESFEEYLQFLKDINYTHEYLGDRDYLCKPVV